MIRLVNIHKSFEDNHVLRGVDLEVPEGSTAVVMGGSGSGKSVLLKTLVQLMRPDDGEVWVDDTRADLLDGDELDALRLSFGYLFQGGALFDSMTVYGNLDFLLDRHTKLHAEERGVLIHEALAWVNLAESAKKFPAELSGGQKKRAGLARAVILKPKILLYDEPTTGLDPISVRTVSDLITRLRDERGITSIAITHDILCAEIIADMAHFLFEGRIIESGPLEELRRAEHPEIRNFFGGRLLSSES